MDFLAALNVAGRLPPGEIDSIVCNLGAVAPHVKKFLLSRLDCRLHILTDESTGKLFIASDFNRMKHSHRSPWSNHYLPSDHGLDELYYPPENLRRIEMALNELLMSYCNLYFENAVGSCFISESDQPNAFFGVFQIKKDFHSIESQETHSWESTHSFKVTVKQDDDNFHVDFAMTSTVLVVFEFGGKSLPSTLNGSASKPGSRSFLIPRKDQGPVYDEILIRNLGELMEENETSLRGRIDQVCIPRCADFAMASLGSTNEEMFTDSSSENMDDDFRPRVSLGTMNPLHRQSIRPEPAFQADLMGAIMQRRLKDDQLGGS
jgi:capping protein beta